MSDLNVVSRTQVIIVDPAIYHVNVIDSLQLGSERAVARLPGVVLLQSAPATFDTGVLSGSTPEQFPPGWSVALPTAMQTGDHIRVRFFGTFYGGTTLAMYSRIYLDSVKCNEIYYNAAPAASQQIGFVDEIDLMYQSVNSAWVWQRHSQSNSTASQGTASATSSSDGANHTLATYSNPVKNLAGSLLTFGFQSNSINPIGLRVRGLTVEHLIAA
jgi:hypothetical protein